MDEINVKNILKWLEEMVKDKKFLDAHTWVNKAQTLNILIGEEHDKLFAFEQDIARARVLLLQGGDTVASSKVKIEAQDIYKEMQKQKSVIKQVEEMIRIAKLQARLKDNEYRNQ